MTSRLLAVAFLLLPIFGSRIVFAKPIRPLSSEDLANRVWVGLTEDELKFFRISLQLDGHGSVGFIYVDKEPEVHEIASWTYKGSELRITTSPPAGSVSGKLELYGQVRGSSMRLTLRGTGWKRKLELRSEADLERRWSKLRAAMTREDG